MTKKILIAVFSIIVISAFGFVITWGVINFNKVQEAMSGTGVYNKEELNKAYEDGYGDGVKDKAEYTVLIEDYRNTIAQCNDTISQLNFQISALTDNNKDCVAQINNLTEQKQGLELQVANLETIKTENENTIKSLNSEIAVLQNQVDQVPELNIQIANLQSLVVQLQTTNSMNVETITSLNNQIANLNQQINNLNVQIYSKSNEINNLNIQILKLKNSISYYENYIALLENGACIVAIFEVDGSIYNIQTLKDNEEIVIPDIPVNEYYVFNGWTVDGEIVDLSTYEIKENTKFVADLIYNKIVTFVVDGELYTNEYVIDSVVSIPDDPVKDGYIFDGWTLDGETIIDLSTLDISTNIVLYAKFTKFYSVTFMLDNEVIETKNVKEGECLSTCTPIVESKDGKYLNGWLLNENLIDPKRYEITQPVILTANMVEPGFYETSVGGNVTVGDYFYVKNKEIYYLLESNSGSVLRAQCKLDKNTGRMTSLKSSNLAINSFGLWELNNKIFYSYNSTQLVYNEETKTWDTKKWYGLTSFIGKNVWQHNGEILYSSGNTQYVLNIETDTWNKKTWSGLTSFDGSNIWQCNGIAFYSNNNEKHYMFNSFLNIWESFTFTNKLKFYGSNVLTFQDEVYCLSNNKLYIIEGNKCIEVSNGRIPNNNFSASSSGCVFTDQEDIVITSDTEIYVFNVLRHEWKTLPLTFEDSNRPWVGVYLFYDKVYSLDYNGNFYEFNAEKREFVLIESCVLNGFTTGLFQWRGEYYCKKDSKFWKYDISNQNWQETNILYRGNEIFVLGELLYYYDSSSVCGYLYNEQSNAWERSSLNFSKPIFFNGKIYNYNKVYNLETKEVVDAEFNITVNGLWVFNDCLYAKAYDENYNYQYYKLNSETNIFELTSNSVNQVFGFDWFNDGDETLCFSGSTWFRYVG